MEISASCTMPSLLMSVIDISALSTAAQLLTQAGSWAKLDPTTLPYTSAFTRIARAGAVK